MPAPELMELADEMGQLEISKVSTPFKIGFGGNRIPY